MHRLPRALTLRQTPHVIQRHIPPRIPRIQRRAKSQVMYNSAGEPVRVQAVRFKKPGLTLRRIATIGIYTGVVYGYLTLLWRYMDVEIEFVDDEEEAEQQQQHKQQSQNQDKQQDDQQQQEEEEAEEEGPPFFADENSTFIPLTWSQQLPRAFYRGSDPEWQAFLTIARDKPRHRKIQDELVSIVYTGSVQHPTISRQLGRDAKIGKYWLDISFPDGPPQEYIRSGIEVGEGFVAWSQQRVSQEKQWRLMRALWPKAAAEGTWATVKVLAGIQWRRMKQALGWEGADPLSPEERYRHAMEMVAKQQQTPRGRGREAQTEPDGSASSSPVVSTGAGAAQSSRPSTTTPSNSPNTPTEPNNKRLPWIIPLPLPTSTTTGVAASATDIPIAMHVFSSTLSKQWNPKKMEPPRGTFIVQGLVEVRGQRGRMLFDVQSCYDPKAGKFVQVNAGVRNFKRWNQAPRGGP